MRIDLKKGETRTADYLRLNPNGKVPLLVHDGTPIWESAAITLYLGEIFGVAKGLYPAPGIERGEAMKWVIWANVTLGGARWAAAVSTPGLPDRRSEIAPECSCRPRSRLRTPPFEQLSRIEGQ